MNTKDISNALLDRLAGLSPGAPVHSPGFDFDPGVVPRFEVTFPSREKDDASLKGGTIDREDGRMRVVICTELGRGEDAGLNFLDGIRALLPKGQRITITGGVITITADPTADTASFPDDTAYRLPVLIRYHAKAT